MTSRETWKKVFKQMRNAAVFNNHMSAQSIQLIGCLDLLQKLVELDAPTVAKVFDTELMESLERTDEDGHSTIRSKEDS